jgi:hypothetical protein
MLRYEEPDEGFEALTAVDCVGPLLALTRAEQDVNGRQHHSMHAMPEGRQQTRSISPRRHEEPSQRPAWRWSYNVTVSQT